MLPLHLLHLNLPSSDVLASAVPISAVPTSASASAVLQHFYTSTLLHFQDWSPPCGSVSPTPAPLSYRPVSACVRFSKPPLTPGINLPSPPPPVLVLAVSDSAAMKPVPEPVTPDLEHLGYLQPELSSGLIILTKNSDRGSRGLF